MANINAKGRTKIGRFVLLPFNTLDHDAWCDMSTQARILYIELRRRFNGLNNGDISLSHREAAEVLHCSKNSARRFFDELMHHGWIKLMTKGRYQNRHASTWVLTTEVLDGKSPTNDWKCYVKIQKPGSWEGRKVSLVDLNSISAGATQ